MVEGFRLRNSRNGMYDDRGTNAFSIQVPAALLVCCAEGFFCRPALGLADAARRPGCQQPERTLDSGCRQQAGRRTGPGHAALGDLHRVAHHGSLCQSDAPQLLRPR